MKKIGLFSKPQVLNLRHALSSIQLVGAKGFDHAVVMPDDVVDILLRCDALYFRRLMDSHEAWNLGMLRSPFGPHYSL